MQHRIAKYLVAKLSPVDCVSSTAVPAMPLVRRPYATASPLQVTQSYAGKPKRRWHEISEKLVFVENFGSRE